jgi:DNA-binding Lrp family transcriptional regulator
MAGSIDDYSPLEQQLLDDFQCGMSLSRTPFLDMAEQLGVSEVTVMQSIRVLQDKGVISRIGPVFRPNRIGVSTLAAMSVAEEDMQRVADIVSAFPEVNHNYERDHTFNLWFVVAAISEQQLAAVLKTIERHTGYSLMSLPMLDDYHIDLAFGLKAD